MKMAVSWVRPDSVHGRHYIAIDRSLGVGRFGRDGAGPHRASSSSERTADRNFADAYTSLIRIRRSASITLAVINLGVQLGALQQGCDCLGRDSVAYLSARL